MTTSKFTQQNTDALHYLRGFLNSYTRLIEDQLGAVQTDMSNAMAEIMQAIMAISSTTDEKAKSANVIFTKKGANGKQTMVREVEDRKIPSEVGASTSCSIGVKRMTDAVHSVDRLDAAIKDLLLSIVGEMSVEDLVSQRFQHLSTALAVLRDTVNNSGATNPSAGSLDEFSATSKLALQKVFASYTMEEEKVCFEKFFGKPA